MRFYQLLRIEDSRGVEAMRLSEFNKARHGAG